MTRLTGNELTGPSFNVCVETPGVNNGVTDLGLYSSRREAIAAYKEWLRRQPDPRSAQKQRRHIVKAV